MQGAWIGNIINKVELGGTSRDGHGWDDVMPANSFGTAAIAAHPSELV